MSLSDQGFTDPQHDVAQAGIKQRLLHAHPLAQPDRLLGGAQQEPESACPREWREAPYGPWGKPSGATICRTHSVKGLYLTDLFGPSTHLAHISLQHADHRDRVFLRRCAGQHQLARVAIAPFVEIAIEPPAKISPTRLVELGQECFGLLSKKETQKHRIFVNDTR